MGSEVFEKIKLQRNTYVKLLKDLLSVCKDSYKILDIYYDQLELGNSTVHILIILATSSLTFLQSYYGGSTDDGSLSLDQEFLISKKANLAFPINNGIPIMIIDKAKSLKRYNNK